MKLKISFSMLLAVPILCSNAIAAYPYKDVCPRPAGGRYNPLYDVDKWNFWKCECTSYAAYKITGDGLAGFRNWYKDAHFSHAGTWGGAAKQHRHLC